MRVLVIHDTRAMRLIVRRALHHLEGIDDVLQAESAESAIDTLQNEPVDLVLCDWNLGGMTGIELLEALRNAQWEVPFGFITAERDEKIRRRALESGASFLLSKPFSEAELADELVAIGAILPYDPDPDPDPEFGPFAPPPLEVAAAEDGRLGEAAEAVVRAAELEALLEKLCSAQVTVAPAHAGPNLHSPRYVGAYHDEAGEVAGLCVFATSFGLAVAASLTRWSASATREWVATGIMPAELLGDLFEVANVLAQFVRRDGKRIIIHHLEGYAPGERFEWIAALDKGQGAEHFEIEVAGYCGGLLSVVAL
ncbi:MAG TPA: response regulator [Acidimicrobiales bacterium]|nr:response regulator [Acidimicrobiales bacterium]